MALPASGNEKGTYDPTRYANDALIQLEPALGLASAVHRGYDTTPQTRGSSIEIRRPGTFKAKAMPISAAEDIEPETVTVTLDQWYGTLIAPRDDELTFTGPAYIQEHVRPQAVEIADVIDQSIADLYEDIPHIFEMAHAADIDDFPGIRRVMFENKVPRFGRRTLMLNGERESVYLGLDTFNRVNESSDGAQTQREGYLGRKFGFDIMTLQNVVTHVPGTAVAASGDNAGAVNAEHAAGVNAMAIDGFTGTETLKKGDTFTIAGNSQRYVLTADVTFATGAATVNFQPALVATAADDAVVTFLQVAAAATKGGLQQNLAFHEQAFALAMAPLSTEGDGDGAMIGRAVDPLTGLALRSRRWYEGKEAKVYIGLDALWGVKTLNRDLAVRCTSK